MIKIVGLAILGIVMTVIGLALRLQTTNIWLYFLCVFIGAIGFELCFYSGKLYGSRR